MPKPTRTTLLLMSAALLATAACSSGEGTSAPTTAPAVPMHLDQIQMLAAHNAYHLEGQKPLLDAITAALPSPRSWARASSCAPAPTLTPWKHALGTPPVATRHSPAAPSP